MGVEHLARVLAADDATRAADRRLREAVVEARAAGETWSAIGGVLGVSRQAAWERFRGDRTRMEAEDPG